MNININIKNDTDKLALTCYNIFVQCIKRNIQIFLKMFYGIHVSQINSLESNYSNITPEPFVNINVSIDNGDKLVKCLDNYTKKEVLDGDNKVLNDKINKKEKAEKCSCFKFTRYIDNIKDIFQIAVKMY